MDKPQAQQILDDSLPDLELIQSAGSPSSTDSARSTVSQKPTLAELRKKFLGDDTEDDGQDTDGIIADENGNEVIVGQVRSKTAGTNPADAPEGSKRTVIVSKNGIVGSQG